MTICNNAVLSYIKLFKYIQIDVKWVQDVAGISQWNVKIAS